MKKKHIVLKVIVCIVCILIVLTVGYKMHMHYDIEEHEFYDVDTMKSEGRDFSASSVVYMTKDISPEGLLRVYEALNVEPEGNVAVKLSTGEAGNPNHLDPALIKDLVQSVDGTIIECNTAYSGSKRADTAMHMQVAKDHGFTDIADVDIMDRDGYISIPVEGGKNLKENWVGKNLEDYDYVLVLTHFKGHPMGGFGGALKNISIGIASREGKVRIHSGGKLKKPTITLSALITNQNIFTESMAEAAKSVYDYEGHGDNITFISVMNRMSVDCDCVSSPAEVDMHDIGILASNDPVALDQACIDLVFKTSDGESLQNRITSLNGTHILTHAEKIGLGNRAYEIVDLDEAHDGDN
ncbi:DUF362 domain-containing protein [Ruminococcus sp.]|uniref:DUF362 domain-containing protein n=1 Tax=Ruminococcus sp. TaxID=41978 RepID=UPI0025FC7E91|nr:DUF362 domain-containing protein [Ruminococcus sp.]